MIADVVLCGRPGGSWDECWPWPHARTTAGYGTATVARKTVYTHRLSYELHVGPVPHGLSLDHLCRNRACWNPRHLEPVTHAENMRRAGEAKTHCPKGHPYAENRRMKGGKLRRDCATCHRERERERGRRRVPK